MKNKLFVGSIAWETRDTDLAKYFSEAGTVTSSSVVMDKFTNRSRGFAFVEMSTEEEAQKAVSMFDGKEFMGRNIVVNISEPKPREERSFGGARSFNNDNKRSFGGDRRGSFGGRRDDNGGSRRDYRS